jgi:hypothetical protein
MLNGSGKGFAWNVAMHYKTTSPRLGRLNVVVGLLEQITLDGVKSEMRTFEWLMPARE